MSIPVSTPTPRSARVEAVLKGNTLLVCGLLLTFWASTRPATAQQSEGMFVTVPNPITSTDVKNLRAQISPRLGDSPQKVTTVIFDFNPNDKPATTPDFGACLSLQTLIQEIHRGGVRTVAFVHANVTGHTVLPVITCSELVMSKGAAIGQVAGENVDAMDEGRKGFYLSALPKDRQGPMAAVIRKMFDPDVRLVRGISKANTPYFADARNQAELDQIIGGRKAVPNAPDGQIGLYSNTTAIDLGLCKRSAETRSEVAELYGLPASAMRDDPLGGRVADVFKWVLSKDIDGASRESVARVIRDVRRKGGNVLILVITGGGNDLGAARALADELLSAQTGEEPIKVVAFVPERATGAGVVVALGCSEIVMFRPKPDAGGEAKEAEIGDFAGYLKTAKPADADAQLVSLRQLAEQQGYSGLLVEGMFKKDLEIVRASKTASANRKQLMTQERFNLENEDAKKNAKPGENPDLWNLDKTIKPKGQLLKLNATLANEVGLARVVVESRDPKAVSAAFGWQDPKDADPGWLEKFSDFLRLPVVTVLLVVIGFTGLILELKVPGLTVPGILAALCFILVFWAHSKFSGQTFVLALMLFLLGLVLVGLEIFVLPGFGACGIFGILAMLAGLGLVTLDKIPQTSAEWGGLGIKVSQYMFALMGSMGLAFFIARFLPKLPGANRLVLNAPVSGGSADQLPGAGEAAELLGAIGTSSTPLRPAGVVKFADKFVDVVSDGGFIPAGTRVQVIQVEGTRIVVKEV